MSPRTAVIGTAPPISTLPPLPRRPLPPRRVGRGPQSYLHFHSLLSPRQLAAARAFVGCTQVQARLADGILFNEENRQDPNIPRKASTTRQRKSRIVWLERTASAGTNADSDAEADAEPDADTNAEPLPLLPPLPEWLHSKLRSAARTAHLRFGDGICPVGVDRCGRWTPRYEPVQYTEYGVGSHYASWHTDAELGSDDVEDARALTVVLLISDTDAFAGGKFQARVGGGKGATVALAAGDAIVFPSKRLEHRVTEITGGLRQSMVMWVTRPGS